MPTKGRIMTQAHYEKEVKYQEVLKVSFWHGEISRDEVIDELKKMSFSPAMCEIKLNEWSANKPELATETNAQNRKRLRELASLKEYFNKKKK